MERTREDDLLGREDIDERAARLSADRYSDGILACVRHAAVHHLLRVDLIRPEILLLMAVQMDETVDWIAERTVEMTILIAFHAVLIRVWMPVNNGDRKDTIAFHTVVTAVWIAVSTVETAVWIADQTVEKVVCNPLSSGVTKATIAFQMEVIFVWIAVSAAPIRIWIACQMVSNRYLNASSRGFMVL